MIYKRPSHKGKFVVAALVVALLSGVYAYYQSDSVSAQSSNLDTQANVTDFGTVDGPGLISIVDKIESIQLDNSIFNDPLFGGLQDRTVTLPAQAVGRSNPFAPLGGQAAPKTITTR